MEYSTTVIAALVAAVSAIIAPVVTALINNRHQCKMKKLEYLQAEKINSVKNFLSSCSNYILANTLLSKDEYYKSYGEIFLYVSDKYWNSIEDLHTDVERFNTQSALKKHAKISQALSEDIKR